MELVVGEARHPMHPVELDWWSASQVLEAGARYGFSIDGGAPIPDPRARRQPEGPTGPSEVFDPATIEWTDHGWKGLPLSGSVLYQIDATSCTAAGTLDAAIERLRSVAELGVEVVCLGAAGPRHPTQAKGESTSRGDVLAGLSAAGEAFGGPLGLARFVDACHARGLAVVLDLHWPSLTAPDHLLAGRAGYLSDTYLTAWGAGLNLDGPDSDEVRRTLIDTVLGWLVDFHLDGVRLLAADELRDTGAVPFLEQLSQAIDQLTDESGRQLWLLVDSQRNDPRVITDRANGGWGAQAQSAPDVGVTIRNALHDRAPGAAVEATDLEVLAICLSNPFPHAGRWSATQRRTVGRPIDPAHTPGWRYLVAEPSSGLGVLAPESERMQRLICAATLLLTSPYTPILRMGQEWGEPWADERGGELTGDPARRATRARGEGAEGAAAPATVNWASRRKEPHAALLRWYKALLALRAARPDLRDHDLTAISVALDEATSALVVHRGHHRVALNLGSELVRVPLELPAEPRCVVLLATDPTARIEDDGALALEPNGVVIVGPTRPRRDSTG